MLDLKNTKIAVIGLGYVGLPLAVEFGKTRPTVGYDISTTRIADLNTGHDVTLETDTSDLSTAKHLLFTNVLDDLRDCNVYIITVPTPIDAYKRPDLGALLKASDTVGQVISRGDVVIYESTVYPGVTEEVCGPALAAGSGLEPGTQIKLAYSPERVNPGDAEHSMENVVKIIAAQDTETLDRVEAIYAPVVKAGLHRASSIATAEAAKVIENTQRDLNIALVNEFSLIFSRLGLDTLEVLEAAGTKWNFLPFRPGLVGGHCISVDPYYLTYKAKEVGYNPEVILAGRRINDGMGMYVVTQLVKALASRKITIDEARVLVMGFTFKGDCPDVRNTKIIDIVTELKDYSMSVDVYDSWANPEEVKHEYGVELIKELKLGTYDALILAVDHSETKKMGIDAVRALGKENHVVYDVKHVFGIHDSDLRL